MRRRALPASWIVSIVALWIVLAGNWALWGRVAALASLHSLVGWLLVLGLGVLVWSGVVAILAALAWRWTLKPAAITALLLTASCGYFMQSYGVAMDPGMLTSAVQTDVQEAIDLLSWRLAVAVLLVAGLPVAWLMWQPVSFAPPWRQLARNALMLFIAFVLAVSAVLAAFQPLAALMRNHKDVRYLLNPLASLYSIGRVAVKPWQRGDAPLAAIATDAHLVRPAAAGQRPTVLLLVLGETARADHFGINGYARNTTPSLARQGVASFRNAWSCGTSTAASVPCMFSHLGRDAFEGDRQPHENLLDVLQRAGLAVLWIDNQAGCKGVCERVPHASSAGAHDPRHCRDGECLDAIMLEDLDARIAALDPARVRRGVVVVMHQMGSHGPAYHRRSPAEAKRFGPECTTSALAECTRESVIDAYDNSILYTDSFLGAAIEWLRARSATADTVMVYVSDHGESLGEGNVYLHGLPFVVAPDAQKRVPWVTWMSEEFQWTNGVSMGCLKALGDAHLSHDNYFHSVIGLMGVRTAIYKPALDVYARCKRGVVAAALRDRNGGRAWE